MAAIRRYPVGIQDFGSIREGGFVYVDKTELIYKMITEGKPYFLSRPRRFGKSLLVSTLAAIFEGRRELFEAFTTEDGIEQPQLYITTTSWRWDKYPVLRFDFSAGDIDTPEKLDNLINSMLKDYELQYGIEPSATDANIRMVNLLRTAHQKTGRQAVVLVDEYDNQMLHSIGDDEKQKAMRQRFLNIFAPLKSEDAHLRFVFITGISKFSQMGVFSRLNQLMNISIEPAYETLLGISEYELTTALRSDIEQMAARQKVNYDEMLVQLKHNYDGYHFSEGLTDMYNPFSLFHAFKSGRLGSYWFASGTPQALIDMLAQMPPMELADLEGIRCPESAFDQPFNSFKAPIPVLYQSGYLTIKDFLPDRQMFVLGTPNQEVRQGFADCLFQYVAHVQPDNSERSIFLDAYYDFRDTNELEPFIEALKTFFASIPYVLDNKNEHHYHALLYTLLVSFGADVVAEEMSAKGRADLVLRMPRGIYVFEIKYDGTVDEALTQIDNRGYARKYGLDGCPVTKVALVFSSEERNVSEWKSLPA